jgi:hypothetical protein
MSSSAVLLSRLPWLADVASQWRANARLRLGVGLVLMVLCLHGLLLVLDHVDALRAEAEQLRSQVQEARSLGRQSNWPDRALEAQRSLKDMQALLWTEPEQGLAEARMQDWVASVASKSGVVVRELSLVRSDAAPGREADGAQPLPKGYARLRLRMNAEFNPATTSVLLAELGQGEHAVRVDRMRVLAATRPPLLELELSSVARLAGAEGWP